MLSALAARLGPRPDSLVAWMCQGDARRNRLWFPVLNLVWLFWMVAAPWMTGRAQPLVVAATLGSLVVFLALYHRSWYGPRASLAACTLGIALMGLAIIPVNSSWSYVIYAGSMLPFLARGWRLVGWLALLLAAFAATALASGFYSPVGLLGCAITTGMIAFLNVIFRSNLERDAELRLSQDEVRRLAAAAERERIGRDLHDLLGHTLSLVAIKAELARKLIARDGAAAARELADIERVARESLAQVREAVTGMRAPALAAEAASARLMLEAAHIRFEDEGLAQGLGLAPEAEAALAMNLREAVTNVQRHARASLVQVRLQTDGPSTVLSVEDNGIGATTAAGGRGNGLAGMAERLAALGGRLDVEARPGGGTLLRMAVPRQAALEFKPGAA